MVIDTSALLAIRKAEPEALALITALSRPGAKWISTATLLETRLVIERQVGEAGQAELERLLATAAITPVPLEEAHVHWALEGWRRFGKGRHPAALNFGDCFSGRPGPGPGGPAAVHRRRCRGHRSAGGSAISHSALVLAIVPRMPP